MRHPPAAGERRRRPTAGARPAGPEREWPRAGSRSGRRESQVGPLDAAASGGAPGRLHRCSEGSAGSGNGPAAVPTGREGGRGSRMSVAPPRYHAGRPGRTRRCARRTTRLGGVSSGIPRHPRRAPAVFRPHAPLLVPAPRHCRHACLRADEPGQPGRRAARLRQCATITRWRQTSRPRRTSAVGASPGGAARWRPRSVPPVRRLVRRTPALQPSGGTGRCDPRCCSLPPEFVVSGG